MKITALEPIYVIGKNEPIGYRITIEPLFSIPSQFDCNVMRFMVSKVDLIKIAQYILENGINCYPQLDEQTGELLGFFDKNQQWIHVNTNETLL